MYAHHFRGRGIYNCLINTVCFLFFQSHSFTDSCGPTIKRFFVEEAAFLHSLIPRFHPFSLIWWVFDEVFQVYELSNWLFEKCSCLTHTFIFQFVLDNFNKWCFHQLRQRGFFLPAVFLRGTTVCLLSSTTLAPAAAAPRGYHFEIITGIQFGFVTGDRALLHLLV